MSDNLKLIFASLMPGVITVGVRFTPKRDDRYKAPETRPKAGYAQPPSWPEDNGSSEKTYTYKALEKSGIKVGDQVLVRTPGSPNAFTVVTVFEIGAADLLEPERFAGYKWVAGTIDIQDYTDVLAREETFLTKVRESRLKAEREKVLQDLAAQLGGMDALKALINDIPPTTDTEIV